MLTVFAKDVLGVGGGGLGLLTASTGVGAVAGALFVASLSGSGRRGRLMFAGLILFGLALLVFATSPWLWLSLGALVAVGVSQQVYLATNNTLIQISTSEEYRGRISSTLFLNRGMVPLGTMLAGFGTSLFSAQVAVGTMAAALVLMAVLVARLAPAARELE
jgi:MFS family permease